MIDTNAFTKLVPGFDFLQGLMQSAGQAVPAMGQWIAPTLNPEELEKRIGELKTVRFWLEQNSSMIGMTIQALEVQRMTLSTLQTMNLPLAELSKALTLPQATPRAAAVAAATLLPKSAAVEPAPAEETAASAKPGAVDPMQWWGALTQQFAELASKTLQDSGAIAARNLAAAKPAAPAAPKGKAARAKPAAAKAARKRS